MTRRLKIEFIVYAVMGLLAASLAIYHHNKTVAAQEWKASAKVTQPVRLAVGDNSSAEGNEDNTVSIVAQKATLDQGQLEAQYFKMRDALRKKSEKAPDGAVDPTLALLKKLTEVVGPFKVDGFPSRGRASPAAISNNPCCQEMDSFEFKNDKGEWLYVTTQGLAKSFYPAAASPLDYIAAMVPLVSFAALPESAATKYADLPVRGANKNYLVHAFVATYNVGDSGTPAAPDKIMVFVFAGDRIFFMASPVKPPEIPECTKKWSEINNKASAPFDAFVASNRKNQKLLEESNRLEAQAIDAAVSCYQQEAKNQPFFASLVKQAQSMVDRIHPG